MSQEQQTNAEIHNDPSAATAGEGAPSGLRRFAKNAEGLARKRLAGTRAERLLGAIPVRVERAIDHALDRAGLVRKTKAAIQPDGSTATTAAHPA